MIQPLHNNNVSFGSKSIIPQSVKKAYEDVSDKVADSLAYALGKVAKTGGAKGFVTSLSKVSKKPTARMADLTSIIYTVKLMSDTVTSKKLEKEEKPALVINAALVTALSIATSFILDKVSDSLTDKMKKSYAEHLSRIPQAEKAKWLSEVDFASGLSKTKSLLIVTLMMRILIPVLSVPITGAIKKSLTGKLKKDKESNNTCDNQSKTTDSKQDKARNNINIKA